MCFGRPPSPPPLPDPEPVAPKAEKTAEQVVTATQRDIAKKGRKAATTTTRSAARRGTASLRIPLLTNQQTESGNLRTPV